ncbi:MAG: cobalt transporter [Rhizobiaceae bacterium MnEN-MB40S]|nr:MAG: cobalt transporter [Rhizobiaceae bacterium MnEN-MB40S]
MTGNAPANWEYEPVTEVAMANRTIKTHTIGAAGQCVTIAVTALIVGAFFIFGAGFANSAVLHDTAHDARHAYGFPCH